MTASRRRAAMELAAMDRAPAIGQQAARAALANWSVADLAAATEAMLDTYYEQTRFVPDGQCGRPQRFKPEPIDE